MRIIKLEQGTPEWLSWRKTVITATDASILMGNNPWDTPYQCWQRKLGLIAEKASSEAMERGKRLEPLARAHFIERYGIEMEPVVVESTEFDFLGASLDGLSQLGGSILEIKCGGAKLHDMAARGEIPAYYQDQMQHQLLVTGAEKCFYYSYNGEDGICIEVFPDPAYREAFLPKARSFWKCVALSEPPPMQEKDYVNRDDDVLLLEDLESIEQLDMAIKDLEEKKSAKRKKVIERCGDQNCICKGKKIMKTFVRGRVDYDAVPELNGVNLDKYRKASTTVWKIMVA